MNCAHETYGRTLAAEVAAFASLRETNVMLGNRRTAAELQTTIDATKATMVRNANAHVAECESVK